MYIQHVWMEEQKRYWNVTTVDFLLPLKCYSSEFSAASNKKMELAVAQMHSMSWEESRSVNCFAQWPQSSHSSFITFFMDMIVRTEFNGKVCFSYELYKVGWPNNQIVCVLQTQIITCEMKGCYCTASEFWASWVAGRQCGMIHIWVVSDVGCELNVVAKPHAYSNV